ncbi:MAG: extracellular solute-binding protein [Actinomycetota bacterium]|nr:extracellular solute-binding protein [Actinomycetota bacterium]
MASTSKRHLRRPIIALAVALVVIAVTAACSGDSESSGGGPVELTLLDHQEPRVELLKKLLPQFEKDMEEQGKDISVKLLEGPAEDTQFATKLTLDYNSGNAPDVASFGNTSTVDFATSGFLLDLTPMTEEWTDWNDHFYDQLREELVQPDGKVYAVPREAQIVQLFYRKDVLQSEGISTEQPQSWDDLLDRMSQVTRKSGQPSLLFPAGEAWGGGTFFEGFIHIMLGTDSPLYDAEESKWIVASPGLTDVLTYYEELTEAGVMPVDPLLNPEPWVPTKYEAFPKGDLVATTCGTWCWIFDWGPEGAAPIEGLFDKVSTWEFPTAGGEETFVWGSSGWVWAISADTENPEEAWELVKWLASGDFMAQNAVTVGAASPRDDLRNVKPYSNYDFLIDAERQLPNARSFVPLPGTDKIVQAVGEATEQVITGRMSGDEAATFFAERATELLGEDNVTNL